jgi:ribonuclease P/MRP protein subunit POP5
LKRVKRRYLALQVDSDGAPSRKEFMDAVWSAVAKLYGEYGASQTSLALIDYDAEEKTAVIRTSLATLDLVRASLASITSLADSKAAVHVLAVSGTIKALRKRVRR